MTPEEPASQTRSSPALPRSPRLENGIDAGPVGANTQIHHAASSYSREMVARHFFDHVSPSGTGIVTRLRRVHYITPRILPGLVPLTLPADHFLRGLSGLTVPATLDLRSATGKRRVSFTDS